MKKNTLIVFIVILTPIIIMGSLAVMGAPNLPPAEHEGTEGENEEVEGDESVPTTVTHAVLPLSYQYSALALASAA